MKFRNYILLLFMFCLATLISSGLSKDSDDEMIYTALASKISSKGFSEYNLRDLSIRNVAGYWKIESQENGNLLPSLTRTGAAYYDTALFFNPPLWPALLAATHKLTDWDKDYFLSMRRGLVWKLDVRVLYSSIPNTLLAVLFLAGTFILARRYLENEVYAYLAMGLCLVSPVFLVCTFKVWSDLLAATLILWSFILYRKNSGYLAVIFAGVLFGLAVLTRTTSWFAAVIFIQRDWKRSLGFFVSVAAISSPWYWAMYRTYGNPLYYPQIDTQTQNSMQWFAGLSRDWYRFTINLLFLSPFFIFCFAAVRRSTGVLWLWASAFIVILSILVMTDRPLAVEDRYLLPVYPALAVLASHGIGVLRKRLGVPLTALMVVCGMAWSLKIGIPLIASRESLRFVGF